MTGEKEPDYFAVDTRSADLVAQLPQDQRLNFYDGLYNAFKLNCKGENYTEPLLGIQGTILKQAIRTMEACASTYWKRIAANPSGKNQHTEKKKSEAIDRPLASDPEDIDQQYNQSNLNQYNINQFKSNLIKEGFEESEIKAVIDRMMKIDKKNIKNPEAYIRKSIEEERKNRRNSPHGYSQRDYLNAEPDPDDVLNSLKELNQTGRKVNTE